MLLHGGLASPIPRGRDGGSSVCGFPLGPGVWAPLPVLGLGEPQPPGMEKGVEMLSFVR